MSFSFKLDAGHVFLLWVKQVSPDVLPERAGSARGLGGMCLTSINSWEQSSAVGFSF